jgi:hypothetical protein
LRVNSARWIPPVFVGTVRFESGVFSNRWRLHRAGETLAELRRDPTRHESYGELADGTLIELSPKGWGTVEVATESTTLGRIDRRSWWGRRWEISGTGFGCDLTSDPMPRRWSFRIGGEPIGRLAGTVWSYNRLEVDADVSMPVHAVVLAWHVLARPWEAAAAPRSLVPDRVPA